MQNDETIHGESAPLRLDLRQLAATSAPGPKLPIIADKRTAVEKTKAAMAGMTEGRKNQARAYFARVEKSRARRKLEKKTKKAMRRSR